MKRKIGKADSHNKNSNPFFSKNNGSAFFGVQPKLNIGEPGDRYEEEADRIADTVVSRQAEEPAFFAPSNSFAIQTNPLAETITPLVQKQEEEEELQMQPLEEEEELQMQPMEEEEELQAQAGEEEEEIMQMQAEEEEEEIQTQVEEEEELQMKGANDAVASNSTEHALQSTKGGGRPLDSNVRLEMETGFGTDFSGVRVHTDSTSVQMNKDLGARAFTSGNDIYFNEGKYAPTSHNGKKLLAHELTHTVQQAGSKPLNIHQKNEVQRQTEIVQLLTDNDFLNTSNLQLMQCVPFFNDLYRVSSNYSIGARLIGDAVRRKFLGEAAKYGMAYDSYSHYIRAAREEAQNQNMWIGIITGVAAGIGLGLLAAFALPSTAAGAFAITLNEALVAGASAAGQAGMGALVTSGVSNVFTVPGGNLEPSGLSPDVVRLNVWRKAAEIYREGLLLVEAQQRLQQLGLQSSELRRQIQLLLAGQSVSVSIEHLRQAVPEIYNTRTRLFGKQAIIQTRLDQQQNILTQIQQTPEVIVREYEKGIWIMWLSDLANSDSDMIDLDAIEDRLLDLGLIADYEHGNTSLGVNFGRWTSKDDELDAIRAARGQRGRIRRLLARMQSNQVTTLNTTNPFSSSEE
jgi:hypothetical protein